MAWDFGLVFLSFVCLVHGDGVLVDLGKNVVEVGPLLKVTPGKLVDLGQDLAVLVDKGQRRAVEVGGASKQVELGSIPVGFYLAKVDALAERCTRFVGFR